MIALGPRLFRGNLFRGRLFSGRLLRGDAVVEPVPDEVVKPWKEPVKANSANERLTVNCHNERLEIEQ